MSISNKHPAPKALFIAIKVSQYWQKSSTTLTLVISRVQPSHEFNNTWLGDGDFLRYKSLTYDQQIIRSQTKMGSHRD